MLPKYCTQISVTRILNFKTHLGFGRKYFMNWNFRFFGCLKIECLPPVFLVALGDCVDFQIQIPKPNPTGSKVVTHQVCIHAMVLHQASSLQQWQDIQNLNPREFFSRNHTAHRLEEEENTKQTSHLLTDFLNWSHTKMLVFRNLLHPNSLEKKENWVALSREWGNETEMISFPHSLLRATQKKAPLWILQLTFTENFGASFRFNAKWPTTMTPVLRAFMAWPIWPNTLTSERLERIGDLFDRLKPAKLLKENMIFLEYQYLIS